MTRFIISNPSSYKSETSIFLHARWAGAICPSRFQRRRSRNEAGVDKSHPYAAMKVGTIVAKQGVEAPLQYAASEPAPEVVKSVLGYFVRNRKAADTLEGITRWRLLEEQINRSLQETEAAIAWLVREGFLEQVQPRGLATPIFRLNPGRHAEAIEYLARKSKKQGNSGAKKGR